MPKPPAMPEAALQAAVIRLCTLLGIWHYHAYQPKRDNPGFPDLLMIGSRGGLWRELKRQDRNPTAIQSEVGLRMHRIGWDWSTWRPSDLQSGRVLRELESIR